MQKGKAAVSNRPHHRPRKMASVRRANVSAIQVSGTQLAKNKEDAAAIMRAKQQAGTSFALHSLIPIYTTRHRNHLCPDADVTSLRFC
jgi:predicted ABC-type transport system involved in lysophospholipase L1 biosynthesis ATPase subunit